MLVEGANRILRDLRVLAQAVRRKLAELSMKHVSAERADCRERFGGKGHNILRCVAKNLLSACGGAERRDRPDAWNRSGSARHMRRRAAPRSLPVRVVSGRERLQEPADVLQHVRALRVLSVQILRQTLSAACTGHLLSQRRDARTPDS